jgi:uncharacterized membrane protein
MNKFFSRNLDKRGRWVRGVGGVVLTVSGLFACAYSVWWGAALIVAGGFMLYEAARGWCVMRACGIKTKV